MARRSSLYHDYGIAAFPLTIAALGGLVNVPQCLLMVTSVAEGAKKGTMQE